MPPKRSHQPPPDAHEDLVYRKINQLTAVQLAVGAILLLLLAIVTILMNGRLRQANSEIARLAARLNNLEDRSVRAGQQRSSLLSPPPTDSTAVPSPDADATLSMRSVAALAARVATPQGGRDARWRADVARLLEELETQYDHLATDTGTAQIGTAKSIFALPTTRMTLRAALLIGDFGAARRWCERLLALDPHDAGSAAEVARLGLAVGQPAAALPLAKIATEADDADPAAVLTRARIEDELGLADQRDHSLTRALAFGQTAPEALAILSKSLLERSDYAALERALAAAERSAPGNAVVGRERLALALATGDLDGAVELSDSLDGEDRRTAGLRVDLGRALLGQGRYADASRIYHAIIEHDPANAAAFDARGIALLALMRTRDAEEAFAGAASLDGTDADAWYHLGVARANLDDLDGALAALDTSLGCNRNHPEALFARAVCLARLGKHEAAEESLLRALALDAALMERAAEVDAFGPVLGGQDNEPAPGVIDAPGR